jgi:hypothetical protein
VVVIEPAEGHYEVQDVEFGRVYRWRPERAVVACDCGERVSLTWLGTTCRCGADHTRVVREELTPCSEDEALHPWRYAGDREDAGLPY